MGRKHKLITGNCFSDDRGLLSFINDFSLKPIVRFYEIAPKNTSIVRAWQAHKSESKWFYCTQGAFKINLVKIDSFENPSEHLETFAIDLNANTPQVLYVPGGYANGFIALNNASKLMVFSDSSLEASKQDDVRFESSKWIKKW